MIRFFLEKGPTKIWLSELNLLDFITGNSIFETLLEGLFAQIHIHFLFDRFSARIEPGTCG